MNEDLNGFCLGEYPPEHPGWKRLHEAATFVPDPVLVDRWSVHVATIAPLWRTRGYAVQHTLAVDPMLVLDLLALDDAHLDATWEAVLDLLTAAETAI